MSPYQVPAAGPVPAKNAPAKTGFILGLCAILGWLLPIVGVPLTTTGIVFSVMGLSRASATGTGRNHAMWGLILNIAFLAFAIINAAAGAAIALKKAGY